MQAYNFKKIGKHTKKEPTIKSWDNKNKNIIQKY